MGPNAPYTTIQTLLDAYITQLQRYRDLGDASPRFP